MAKPAAPSPRAWNSNFPARKHPMGYRKGATSAHTFSTPKSSGTPRGEKRSSKPASHRLGKGKRTKLWDDIRAKLKVNFQRAGITRCEVRCEGCWNSDALSFAHSLKRRFIKTVDDWTEVALACTPCHDILEAMPHQRMADIVRSIIQARPVPVEKIFE